MVAAELFLADDAGADAGGATLPAASCTMAHGGSAANLATKRTERRAIAAEVYSV